jgi:hypothetical protein
MIRPGFLNSEPRRNLIELARDGSAAHRLARRANALVLLDKGMSCRSVAEALLPANASQSERGMGSSYPASAVNVGSLRSSSWSLRSS